MAYLYDKVDQLLEGRRGIRVSSENLVIVGLFDVVREHKKFDIRFGKSKSFQTSKVIPLQAIQRVEIQDIAPKGEVLFTSFYFYAFNEIVRVYADRELEDVLKQLLPGIPIHDLPEKLMTRDQAGNLATKDIKTDGQKRTVWIVSAGIAVFVLGILLFNRFATLDISGENENASSSAGAAQTAPSTPPPSSPDAISSGSLPPEWSESEGEIWSLLAATYPSISAMDDAGKRALIDNTQLVCQAYSEGYSRLEILNASSNPSLPSGLVDDLMTLSVSEFCPEYLGVQLR